MDEPLPQPGSSATTPNPETTERVLADVGARLDQLELETQPAYYANYLQELDTETDSGDYVNQPDLQLAVRGLVQGSWLERESIDTYFKTRLAPLLERPGAGPAPGFDILAMLEHEVAGMATQTSENSLTRKQARLHFGSDEKYQSVMASFDAAKLPPANRRTLKIIATGILAGIASDDRQNRLDNLKQLILS
jgi:hypothetical protein